MYIKSKMISYFNVQLLIGGLELFKKYYLQDETPDASSTKKSVTITIESMKFVLLFLTACVSVMTFVEEK